MSEDSQSAKRKNISDILMMLLAIGGGLVVVFIGMLLCWSGLLLLVVFGVLLLLVSGYVVALLLWHLTTSLLNERRSSMMPPPAPTSSDDDQRARSIDPDDPLHVLLVLLSIHQRVMDGEGEPWTARALEGLVLLRIGSNLRTVGYLSKDAAAEVSNRLASRGVIEGRGDRRAGDYVPVDAGEAIRLYLGDRRL